MLRSRNEAKLSRVEFGRIVATRKQMAIGVERRGDRRVSEPLLDDLGRQLKAAILAAIDAPRGIEVKQRMQVGVFRVALGRDDASLDLGWLEAAMDDVRVVLDVALASRENQVALAFRAGKLPLPERVGEELAERDGALASFGLGCAGRLGRSIDANAPTIMIAEKSR
jgi:hypothetical protein